MARCRDPLFLSDIVVHPCEAFNGPNIPLGTAPGSVLALLSGQLCGSFLGRFNNEAFPEAIVINGAELVVGSGLRGTVGDVQLSILEVLPEGVNSPRENANGAAIHFAVVDPSTWALPNLQADTNETVVGTPAGTFISSIHNTTVGSIVAITNLSVAGSVTIGPYRSIITGASLPSTATTITFDLVETLAGIGNSPHTTTGLSVKVYS